MQFLSDHRGCVKCVHYLDVNYKCEKCSADLGGKMESPNRVQSPAEVVNVIFVWFNWVGFYGISTLVGYLMPKPLYTYILNIYNLVWLGFMAHQSL